MWCDEAKSVGSQKYWFDIVFGILQLLVSLEPIDQFQWGFLQNVALKMLHTVNYKNENWIWPTSDWFCLITSHILLSTSYENPSKNVVEWPIVHIMTIWCQWPQMTPTMTFKFMSHMCPHPNILLSTSPENPSQYLDTVTNSAYLDQLGSMT